MYVNITLNLLHSIGEVAVLSRVGDSDEVEKGFRMIGGCLLTHAFDNSEKLVSVVLLMSYRFPHPVTDLSCG